VFYITFIIKLIICKRADFIVIDRNLLEIPENDIIGAQVMRILVDCSVVFE
jgi:predicted amidohydrolase YtcJ